MSYAEAVAIVYVAGVLCGVFMTDGRPVERIGLALLWPIGPVAFIVTALVLLFASVIAFPAAMLPAALAVALVGWMSC